MKHTTFIDHMQTHSIGDEAVESHSINGFVEHKMNGQTFLS